ncbi:MAG: hypothetical protein QXI84_09245 [Thermofilaceae archaeon]
MSRTLAALALVLAAALAHAQSINVGALENTANTVLDTAARVMYIIFNFIPVISIAILAFWVYLKRDIDSLTRSMWFYFILSAIVIWFLIGVGETVSPEFNRMVGRLGVRPFWLS